MPGLIIVGAGPGASVARRFAREGLVVGMIARREQTLTTAVEALGPDATTWTTTRAAARVGTAWSPRPGSPRWGCSTASAGCPAPAAGPAGAGLRALVVTAVDASQVLREATPTASG